MRVLFLTPRALHEPRSGGTIKSAALLAHLERSHEVDVACFVPPGERAESRERGEPGADRRGAGRTVAISLRRPRSAARLVASYAHRIPLSIERNRSRDMADAVRRLLNSEDHEAVFVDGWLMAQYLPQGFGGRTLLHQHNAEHVMWRRQAELERAPLRRGVLGLEAARVRRYEAAMLSRFDVVFAVSEPDRAALLALDADLDVRILPNVPDPSLLGRPPLEPPKDPVLLFLGTLSWQPNVEGLERFLRGGFPSLRGEMVDARLILAGAGASSSLVSLATRTPGVEFLGEVPDDEPLYRRARALVDLGIGGAGTRVKLLNALARGLPAVATRDAANGLDVVPGDHLLLVDEPSAAVPQLVRVLTDDDLWRRLSRNGRELIRTRFLPEVAFAELGHALGD
jgi:glycosyltransferase involved in cell wall biosynthesis